MFRILTKSQRADNIAILIFLKETISNLNLIKICSYSRFSNGGGGLSPYIRSAPYLYLYNV